MVRYSPTFSGCCNLIRPGLSRVRAPPEAGLPWSPLVSHRLPSSSLVVHHPLTCHLPSQPPGTPLVCSRTGGLGDRVVHYSEATRAGNGVFFEEHTHQVSKSVSTSSTMTRAGRPARYLTHVSAHHQAVLAALGSALRLARRPEHHAALRRNARAAACDVAQTAWRWRGELLRLRTCLVLRQVDRSLHTEDEPRKPAVLPP